MKMHVAKNLYPNLYRHIELAFNIHTADNFEDAILDFKGLLVDENMLTSGVRTIELKSEIECALKDSALDWKRFVNGSSVESILSTSEEIKGAVKNMYEIVIEVSDGA